MAFDRHKVLNDDKGGLIQAPGGGDNSTDTDEELAFEEVETPDAGAAIKKVDAALDEAKRAKTKIAQQEQRTRRRGCGCWDYE